jgi:Protein of unknown function (DUF3500)
VACRQRNWRHGRWSLPRECLILCLLRLVLLPSATEIVYAPGLGEDLVGVKFECDEPPAAQSEKAIVVAASVSARGFAQARDIMRLNGLLAEVTGTHDDYAEWLYFLSFFGEPARTWQIDGHHLCVNCTVIGDQLVLTPAFMGSEPCHVFSGPLAGTMVFTTEERAGLSLIRSLGDEQPGRAILQPSIHPGDLPAGLQDPLDGRIAAGAWRDNAVIPYAGVCAADLSEHQRHRLRALVATYVGWACEGHSGVKMFEVDRHLDETYFAWMGAVSDDGPFYYRVHSPVVLIEFDHHPGVAFDNPVPSPNHIHTIVRTPNGGDYGADLLRQHHERFDHTNGTHALPGSAARIHPDRLGRAGST